MREDRGRLILAVEKETCRWHQFKPLKQIILVSNDFFWWEKFILGVFFTFKVHEKINMSSSWFLVRADFDFWDGISAFLRL